MEKNPFARGFGDLIVYQKARSVSMIDRADDFQGTDHARVREAPSPYGSLTDFFSPADLQT
jgi:hypothetical protein